MIVRSSFKCSTCGQGHTLRIGIGFEERHIHRFPCENCGEEIVIAMIADQTSGSYAYPEEIENAERIDEEAGYPIVNLHANFLYPKDQKNTDFAFPHLRQMHQIAEAGEAAGTLKIPASLEALRSMKRPFQRREVGLEWQSLKKAWRLHRNKKAKLSAKVLEEASQKFYGNDSLNNLEDWIFRFTGLLGAPAFEQIFAEAAKESQSVFDNPEFRRLKEYYEANLVEVRADRYQEAFKSFFSSWSEFSQVYLAVVNNVKIDADMHTSSTDFYSVRMFYGNTFETLSSSVDMLAYLNNIISGRKFDEFESMNIDKYRKIDKSSRANPFKNNSNFSALCREWDNQIRNASHHGGMRFDQDSQVITLQSGKGGSGTPQTLTYTEYLARSVTLFLQLITLMRLEILLCHQNKVQMPI